MHKVSTKRSETSQIAKKFLHKITTGGQDKDGARVVGLSGELGAGKTAFVQEIAKHLAIKSKIASPTFVIMKKYSIKKLNDYKFLFHLDAYRLKSEKELLGLGWQEIIGNKEHLVFIEWPENVAKIMPSHTKFVYVSHAEGKKGNKKRNFKL